MAFHDDVDEVEHYDDPDNGEESSQVRLRLLKLLATQLFCLDNDW